MDGRVKSTNSSSTECRVRIGPTLVALRFADAKIAAGVRRHLGVPFEEGEPDIRLQVPGLCRPRRHGPRLSVHGQERRR